MLRLEAVGKRYGRGRWVLTDVTTGFAAGEVVAVTGGNGSGKSTLLRMLVGLTRPSTGSVSGRPRAVGYVPERFPAGERMSATAYLTHMGRVRGLTTRAATAAATGLLDRLALVGGADTPIRQLSKGNAQKVALAQALLVRPELLVLDEPWSGLDVSAHGVLSEIITEVAAAGGCVVFTDHREAVTSANATRTHRISGGRLSSADRPAGAGHAAAARVVLAWPAERGRPDAPDWPALPGVRQVADGDGRVSLRVAEAHCDALLLTALTRGWSVVGVSRPHVADRAAGPAVEGSAR
ncbi:ATP-binding cassette domain-containing protein [Goodfellowiella coeruleoviolacea]|uniref:ABC-type multidrug transport system, ATPase component n=1 Tax=Goodfellowiella coeruleoviolacea TaxID=334858 RepID=A0AAE3G9E5_9PSEU|nr:ABC transporter ATP-binding protein [Goodfellowiella coeruleoviolacea]MCP2163683.1 ABC-type multidrug transport system, ATPase component [Goodfellowiella coeruleoviolacea]